jgi:hypothetical protein
MDDQKKKADMEFATQVIMDALLRAIAEVIRSTGAVGVHVEVGLEVDKQSGNLIGGSKIGVVYPKSSEPAKEIPGDISKLVEAAIAQARRSRGN